MTRRNSTILITKAIPKKVPISSIEIHKQRGKKEKKRKGNFRHSQLPGVEDHVVQEDHCPKNSAHVKLKRINFRIRA